MYNQAMEIEVQSEQELGLFGARLGAALTGGEVIELVGDVGAGKTTLAKAIAAGMGIIDTISSPSYTLSQTYVAPSGLRLVHYDFYRLDDPGILTQELAEVLTDPKAVVAVEWSGIVENILPADCARIQIVPTGEAARQLTLMAGGDKSQSLIGKLT